MVFDLFTVAGIVVVLLVIVATLWAGGCCQKR